MSKQPANFKVLKQHPKKQRSANASAKSKEVFFPTHFATHKKHHFNFARPLTNAPPLSKEYH